MQDAAPSGGHKSLAERACPWAGAALGPQAAEAQAAEWAVLRPALLRQVRAWVDPKGARGWRDDDGAVADSEALTAVLSLYRFLLLRESAMASNLTGVVAAHSCNACMTLTGLQDRQPWHA